MRQSREALLRSEASPSLSLCEMHCVSQHNVVNVTVYHQSCGDF